MKTKPIDMKKLNAKIKEGAERIKTKKEALLGVIPNTTAIKAIVDKRKEDMEIGDTPSKEIPILGWELYATGEWPIIPEILCDGPIYLIAPDGRYYSLDDWTVYEDRGDWYMNAPLPPAE